MTENPDIQPDMPMAATPVIRERRSLSIVWLIPLIAVLIGGYLAYKAVAEKGPTIYITFASAEGLEAGKTKVKFKDVEVGVVEMISIGEDFSQVILKVQMNKGAAPYLTENTQFWVVRARITASEVSGLGTLLGGAYIGVEPSTVGKTQHHFKGLEIPPVVTSAMKGRHFVLSADRLGSLSPGSPIYFRQIHVGQVVNYQLDEQGKDVAVNIFINSPYDQFVHSDTRFWLASGLDLQLTADGLNIDTESLVSILVGGIAFNTFSNDSKLPEAEEYSNFKLFENRRAANDAQFTSTNDFYIEFSESVRGLSVGAPLEFRGFLIGSVVDIELNSDFESLEFSTFVRVSVESQRLALPVPLKESVTERFTRMANKGLRGQLKTGNLLTGKLFVDVDFHDGLPPPVIKTRNDLPVLPSVVSPSHEIIQDVGRIVKKIDNLPLEKIGDDLQKTMSGFERVVNGPRLKDALQSLQGILAELNSATKIIAADTIPRVNTALAKMNTLMLDMQGWVAEDSLLYDDVQVMLEEFSRAARSINDLADLLERHPEALIQGKTYKDR